MCDVVLVCGVEDVAEEWGRFKFLPNVGKL